MRDEKITMVLVPGGDEGEPWRSPGTIVLGNYSLLEAALHAGVVEFGREIARVVFDRSIDASRYLTFLSSLPQAFRGDVLLILPSGAGFLSAVSRDDGRYMYRLAASDVTFYREAVLRSEDEGEPEVALSEPIPFRRAQAG